MNLSQVVVENSLLLSSIIIKENDHIVLLAEEEEGLRGIKNFGNKKKLWDKVIWNYISTYRYMLLLVSTRVYFTRFVLYGWYDILQFTSRKTYLNVPKGCIVCRAA